VAVPEELSARDSAKQDHSAGLAGTKRGSATRTRPTYEKGYLRIDFDAYEVFLNDRKIDLTLREFNLLRFLVESPNRVFSRVQILDSVWGGNTRITPRAIDVHIRRLRKRLELDDARPELIVTVRGVGYKFDDRVLISRGR
jgi:DNA-binding response OmpR family regulator